MIIVLSNDQLTHSYTKKYLLQMLNITNGKKCEVVYNRAVARRSLIFPWKRVASKVIYI